MECERVKKSLEGTKEILIGWNRHIFFTFLNIYFVEIESSVLDVFKRAFRPELRRGTIFSASLVGVADCDLRSAPCWRLIGRLIFEYIRK